jgi:type II secretory pathway component PulJ
MTGRRGGFTLLEVLAVALLTAVVLGAALAFYVNLSRASARAQETTRDVRRAAAVLDRVARDLERVVLVQKPEEVDPLEHPWIFLGESRRGGAGSDRLKFVTRGRSPRRSASPESDLEVVAYAVREGPESEAQAGAQGGSLELLRWSSTRLPDRLDREVPDDESEGALLLADGLAGFGVTFIDELGEPTVEWDSSSLVQSGQLPQAVEIEVALADRDDPEAEPATFRRRVILPLRPLDLEELRDPGSAVNGGSDQEGDEQAEDDEASAACASGPCAGLTVCQAVNCAQDLGPSVNQLLQEIGSQPFCRWRDNIPTSLTWIIRDPACR